MERNANYSLHLSDDPDLISTAFKDWLEYLTSGAAKDSDQYRLGTLSFRRLRSKHDNLRLAFWIEDSPDVAVQINEPNQPESENSLSGLAVDDFGRRFIIRQAWLKKNNVSGSIRDANFSARTGLPTANVRVANRVSKRQWHVVADLDSVDEHAIRESTVNFVRLCWIARNNMPMQESYDPTLSHDDREWTEGNQKLVTHLKRERAPGLSKAKRDQF